MNSQEWIQRWRDRAQEHKVKSPDSKIMIEAAAHRRN